MVCTLNVAWARRNQYGVFKAYNFPAVVTLVVTAGAHAYDWVARQAKGAIRYIMLCTLVFDKQANMYSSYHATM
jgi:hypothetical protein